MIYNKTRDYAEAYVKAGYAKTKREAISSKNYKKPFHTKIVQNCLKELNSDTSKKIITNEKELKKYIISYLETVIISENNSTADRLEAIKIFTNINFNHQQIMR